MFYIMNEFDGRILEAQHSRPTQEELQDTANFMQCAVYVIQGEHTGMSAAPVFPAADIEDGAVEFDEAYEHDFWTIKAGIVSA